MKVSMNGLRRQMTADATKLRNTIECVVNGDYFEREELRGELNDLLCHINVLNCIYMNDDPDFSDMSDVEVEHIDEKAQ